MGLYGLALGFCAFLISLVAKRVGESWLLLLLLFGCAAFMWGAHKLVNRSMHWFDGGHRERKVGALLSQLESDGYRVAHGIWRGRGDVDHVLIGPAGVFAIDTKGWTRRPRVRHGCLFVGRQDRSGALRQVAGQALFIRKHVGREIDIRWVEAILAFSEVVPYGGCRRTKSAWVMPAEDVVGYVRSRPTRLSPHQVERAAHALADLN